MGRNDRRNRRQRGKNNWNEVHSKGEARPQREEKRFYNAETEAELAGRESAIREFKARENICPACGKPITDIAEAIADQNTGVPMHFDCVLEKVKASENPRNGQQVAYIGQGRFALISYENPREQKSFKIEKIIEWEDKNKPSTWRGEMADLYSKVK